MGIPASSYSHDRILGRNDNASVAGLVDVGSYSACIVDKENQRIPYGRVKISREVQVIRQDLSGEGTDEFFLPFVVLISAV